MNIYLIGYRCTGKTSVGKCLAAGPEWRFVDADAALVCRHGVTIQSMVEAGGWDGFRRNEKQLLADLCTGTGQVVATGGGAVLDGENVDRMKKSGIVIWLKASPATIKERIVSDRHTGDQRPSLTGKGLLEEIEDVLEERLPLYEDAMDLAVVTDDRNIQEISQRIWDRLAGLKMLDT